MKRITAFCLLCLLFLTGCQPTPEVEPVIHKNEGTLEQQISATAAPVYQIDIGEDGWKEPKAPATECAETTAAPKEKTLREAVDASETVQDSFDDQTAGGGDHLRPEPGPGEGLRHPVSR